MGKFTKMIRKQFFTGLYVLLPFSLTLYFVWFLFFHLVGKKIYKLLLPLIDKVPFLDKFPVIVLTLMSLLVTVVLIWFIGMITRNIIGRYILKLFEFVLMKAPFINRIYDGLKHIIETLIVSKQAFRSVVRIEYPRKGIYTLGFITSEVREKDRKILHIFVPTTPNPTSGYFIFISDDEVKHLDITVEEGMKMIISGGIVIPEGFKHEMDAKKLTDDKIKRGGKK